MEKSPNIKKSSPHSLCLGLHEVKDRQAGGIPHVENLVVSPRSLEMMVM